MFAQSCNDKVNDDRRGRIQALLRGNNTGSRTDAVDIEMLFVASFFPGAIVVTNDGRVLGAGQELRKEFHIQVMTDSEVVALIAKKIEERDLMETKFSMMENRIKANWVGEDSPSIEALP